MFFVARETQFPAHCELLIGIDLCSIFRPSKKTHQNQQNHLLIERLPHDLLFVIRVNFHCIRCNTMIAGAGL